MVDYVILLVAHHGYSAIFLSLMLGIIALPIPDEILMTFVGVQVLRGKLEFVPALAAAWLGTCCGITVSYLLGRTLGHALVVKLHGSPEKAEKVRQWFNRRGKWSLTVGYYVPGVRHFTAIVAGTTQLSFHVFALFAYSGAFIWALSYITLGYFLGEPTMHAQIFLSQRWVHLSETTHFVLLSLVGIAALGVAVWFAVKTIRYRFCTKKQP